MDKPEKRKDQEVPLVIYKGGERIEVGRAILKGDGSIIAQVAKDVKAEFKDLLFGNTLGDMSLNPKVLLPRDTQYSIGFNATTKEALEAAVIPPLKIQE